MTGTLIQRGCGQVESTNSDSTAPLREEQRGTRKGFFQDIQTLTKYLLFDSWPHLIDFMLDEATPTTTGNTSYLHSFTIRGIDYGEPMPDFGFDEMGVREERSVKLSKVISGEGFKFSYLYDFGDSWEHEILVEKVLPAEPDTSYPVCIKAKRACPPEDCGGVWGYQNFLDAIQSADHPEHEEMLEWVGGFFDPEDADLDGINHLLKMMSHDRPRFEG